MTDISSMTNAQLNEALAEWRGWEKCYDPGPPYTSILCYLEVDRYEPYKKVAMPYNDWQPATDLNQAFMFAEHIQERFLIEIYTSTTPPGVYEVGIWERGKHGQAIYKTETTVLSRALVIACLSAMEER